MATHQPGQGRRRAGRAPRGASDDLRHRRPRPLHARRPGRAGRGPRPGPAGRVPVHPRRPAHDVPRPAAGRCASTPASPPPPRPTRASATCSSRARPGLSVAFDLPTQMGYDSDASAAAGRGRPGRRPDQLDRRHGDAARRHAAGRGHDVDDHQRHRRRSCWPSTSRPPNGGASRATELGGTVQNDILKEYIARGTYIYPPRPSMRLVTDVFEFCATRAAALEHDLDQRLPHARGRRDGRPGAGLHARRRHRLRRGGASRAASTSTTSPAGCRSSSRPGASCSRRSPSSAPPAACGRGSCATGSAPRTRAR